MNRKALVGIAPLLAVLLAFGMTSGAFAQAPSFDELDANGDGYISRDEAAALPCLADAFDQIGPESSEGLNRSEYARGVALYCAD